MDVGELATLDVSRRVTGRNERLLEAFEEGAGTPHYMDFSALDLRARFTLAHGAQEDALERRLERWSWRGGSQILRRCWGRSERGEVLRESGRVEEAGRLVDEVLAWWRTSDVSGMSAALDVAWMLRQLGHEQDMLEILDARTWRPHWFDAAERILQGDAAGAADICR